MESKTTHSQPRREAWPTGNLAGIGETFLERCSRGRQPVGDCRAQREEGEEGMVGFLGWWLRCMDMKLFSKVKGSLALVGGHGNADSYSHSMEFRKCILRLARSDVSC